MGDRRVWADRALKRGPVQPPPIEPAEFRYGRSINAVNHHGIDTAGDDRPNEVGSPIDTGVLDVVDETADEADSGSSRRPPRGAWFDDDRPPSSDEVGGSNDAATYLSTHPIDHAIATEPRSRNDRTRWAKALSSSAAVHAAIVLLMIVVAVPMHLGHSMHALVFSVDAETESSAMTLTSLNLDAAVDLPAAETVADVVNIDAPSDALADVIAQIEAGRSGQAGDSSDRGGGSASPAGPPGSFFGLQTYGHKIVYIVDRSGSMVGRRFEVATNELMRSIEGLKSDQDFAVIFFSDGATGISADGRTAKTVPDYVGIDDREPITRRISLMRAGGGTDPRRALRMALGLQPDCIVMLSDGEFEAPVDSIIEAVASPPIIQAVSLHDRTSMPNMKQLAEATGGEFRFVPDVGGPSPVAKVDPSVAAMRTAIAGTDGSTAALAALHYTATTPASLAEIERMLKRQIERDHQTPNDELSDDALAQRIISLERLRLPDSALDGRLSSAHRERFRRRFASNDPEVVWAACRDGIALVPDRIERHYHAIVQTAVKTAYLNAHRSTDEVMRAKYGELIEEASNGSDQARMWIQMLTFNESNAAAMLEKINRLRSLRRNGSADRMTRRLIQRYPNTRIASSLSDVADAR